MGTQLDVIPCKILRYQQFPTADTAYAKGFALGEDGLRYIVKSNRENQFVCANELVFTSLADFLHIPVAPTKVLQAQDGELVFGTQVVEPRLSDLDAVRLLTSRVSQNDLISPELLRSLSATYAFDLFVGNYDRHDRNFIFSVEQAPGQPQKTARLRAIDFDAAGILNESLLDLPMPVGSNTVRYGRKFRRAHGFDLTSARSLLDRLARGGTVIFDRAMIGLPESWLSKKSRNSVLEWVKTPKFQMRIDQLEQGLIDGTYL